MSAFMLGNGNGWQHSQNWKNKQRRADVTINQNQQRLGLDQATLDERRLDREALMRVNMARFPEQYAPAQTQTAVLPTQTQAVAAPATATTDIAAMANTHNYLNLMDNQPYYMGNNYSNMA